MPCLPYVGASMLRESTRDNDSGNEQGRHARTVLPPFVFPVAKKTIN